jgi:hypothetical protein
MPWTARHCLDKGQLAAYNVLDEDDCCDQWPFDDDQVAHAIGDSGENIYIHISVKGPRFADDWAQEA